MAVLSVAPEANTAPRSSRLADMVQMANGLNAARVFASLLVVIFHAAIPYMTSPVPIIWIVHDTAQHVSIDMLVFCVNGFAMPLFFLLAGLSIAKSSMQKPFWEFARQRISRLGSTFLLAAALILPILFLGWGIGLLWTERLTISNLSRLNIPREIRIYFGPAHLWFLEYLLLLSIAWAAISRIGQHWSLSDWLIQGKWTQKISGSIFGSIWGPLICAVPTAIILLIDIETPFRLIPQFAPNASRLSYYFVFMVAGVWLANQPSACSMLRASAPRNLLVAMVVFVGLGPFTMSFFDKTLTSSGQWILAALHGIFAWSMVLGFLGAMIRWCSKPSETMRYNNEASFWIYLAHLPIICIMQLVMLRWELNPWFKILIVAATGILISLVLYEFCIRYSLLGAVINGRRIPHVARKGWRLEAGWLSLVAVGVTLFSGFLWMGWNSICNHHLHPVPGTQVFRCNQPSPNELAMILEQQKIRSVISLATANETNDWVRSQRQLCARNGVSLITLGFSEFQIPSAVELRKLQIALTEMPHPVLLIGGKRSPTLSSFGSAVAVLMDEGTIENAMEQFDLRYFQLEGAERCIVAQPLREYRQWLTTNRFSHSVNNFCRWTATAEKQASELAAVRDKQPDWQAKMGAPRYPRHF